MQDSSAVSCRKVKYWHPVLSQRSQRAAWYFPQLQNFTFPAHILEVAMRKKIGGKLLHPTCWFQIELHIERSRRLPLLVLNSILLVQISRQRNIEHDVNQNRQVFSNGATHVFLPGNFSASDGAGRYT